MGGDVVPQIRLADAPDNLSKTQNCATQRTALKCGGMQVIEHHLFHLAFYLQSVQCSGYNQNSLVTCMCEFANEGL